MDIPEIFKFNDYVSRNFDSHVNEQLPWYSLATDFVCHLACHYLNENGDLLDVGASTGNITKSLGSVIRERCVKAQSIDSSDGMRENFDGVGSFNVCKIEDFELKKYDVVVCFLSIMFVDASKRSEVIKSLMESVKPNGCIIIVDKFTPMGGYIGSAINRMTIKAKLQSGVTPEDIIKKELSLIGVQRPMEFEYVKSLGFFEFFRFGDFSGLIYEKPNY